MEQIWALILGTARYLTLEDTGVKAKRQLWQSTIPIGLAGKTLGLVGVGRLGSQTAKFRKSLALFFVTGTCLCAMSDGAKGAAAYEYLLHRITCARPCAVSDCIRQ